MGTERETNAGNFELTLGKTILAGCAGISLPSMSSSLSSKPTFTSDSENKHKFQHLQHCIFCGVKKRKYKIADHIISIIFFQTLSVSRTATKTCSYFAACYGHTIYTNNMMTQNISLLTITLRMANTTRKYGFKMKEFSLNNEGK